MPLLEQLSLAPSTRPATLVSRQFLLSPGKMQIEMCLDRAVVYYGEKLSMHVQITNNSSRTIRKIKCKLYQVSQLSFASGERRAPLHCLETTEGCPIPPGATFQRVKRKETVSSYDFESDIILFCVGIAICNRRTPC